MSRPQIFLCHCLACFYFRVDVVSPHSFKHLGKQARPFSFQKTSCSFFCCDLEILSILIIFVFSVLRGAHVCCIVVMIIITIIVIIVISG